MAVSMTRAEYKKKYGVDPVIHTDTFDTNPAPRRMTRAEYEAEFNPKVEKQNFLSKSGASFPASKGGTETIVPNVAKAFGNIPSSARDLTKEAIAPVNPMDLEHPLNIGSNVVKSGEALLDIFKARGFTGGIKDIAGGFVDTAKKGYEMWKGAGEAIYQNLEKNVTEQDSVKKGVGSSASQVLESVATMGIEDPLLIPSIIYAPAKVRGTGFTEDAISATARPITRGADTSLATVANKVKVIQQTRKEASLVKGLEEEIFKIENNYAKTRKLNEFTDDAGVASRKRIAETDVLASAVDDTGTLRTKGPGGAVEKYYDQTIKGKEAVVRENLVREGAKINLAQVQRELSTAVAGSGLEGADLMTALNGVKKEIQGLKLRADEFGDIALEKLHDAKINTTKNIDFNTPPEVKTYRKTIARGYKELVENSSKTDVKKVNSELSKYYQDIERLEALDGRKVRGGKLGKYSAQIAGNIAGGATGGLVGGLGGSAIGTIIGGETASFLKGRQMAKTFGKDRGRVAKPNPILEKASADAKLPKIVDLSKPSPKVGAPKGITKTKEIHKLERDIAKNVEAQKKAIKAGNFALVQSLKEIYDQLVTKLKEVIKQIKNTPNKKGGFVNFGEDVTNPQSPSPKSGKSPERQSPVLSQSSTNGATQSNLAQEARKYKSAEEFVNKVWGGRELPSPRPPLTATDKISGLTRSGQNKVFASSDSATPPTNLLYHGTPVKFSKFDTNISEGGATWFTSDKGEILSGKAGAVQGAGQKLNVMERLIKPNLKLATPKQADDLFTDQLIAEGYRGVKYPATKENAEWTKLWFPNEDTLTKSQLTDIWNKANGTPYKEKGNLTTKILKDLEGKTTVSKQYILDATNRPELKQVERDLIRDILERETGGKTYYHVTSADNVGSIKEKGFLPQIGDRSRGAANAKGTWLYESKNPTTEFSKNFKNPTVVEAKVNGGIFDAMSDDRSIRALVEDKKLIAKLKSEGYVGIKGDELGTEATFIFEPKALKPSSDTINVSDFAKKVKAELLPLKIVEKSKDQYARFTGYEGTTLDSSLRGNVAKYKENIYESPIKTSAGDKHFPGDTDNYFGHTRIEDMADNKTRRVIEVQSDLYQKGNLERELPRETNIGSLESTIRTKQEAIDHYKRTGFQLGIDEETKAIKEVQEQIARIKRGEKSLKALQREAEISKLQQYNDPTAHFRMVREEIKKAAQDGKTKLQFPTGETAMKIEGLGDNTRWYFADKDVALSTNDLKVGLEINGERMGDGTGNWIITDVLGDGKFKAVPKDLLDRQKDIKITKEGNKYIVETSGGFSEYNTVQEARNSVFTRPEIANRVETFDISGKVDTSNPIYKFYEKDMQRYLTRFGGKRITDAQGVEWIEVPIKKEWGKLPVEAFGLAPLFLGNDE